MPDDLPDCPGCTEPQRVDDARADQLLDALTTMTGPAAANMRDLLHDRAAMVKELERLRKLEWKFPHKLDAERLGVAYSTLCDRMRAGATVNGWRVRRAAA